MTVDIELLKCAVTMGILFFILSHPILYRFFHKQFYNVMAFVDESMCPTEAGVFVHALVFVLVVYFGKQFIDKQNGNDKKNNGNNVNNLNNMKSNDPKDKLIRRKCRAYCQEINNQMNNAEVQVQAPAMNHSNGGNQMNNLTGPVNNNLQNNGNNYGHSMNALNNNINMNVANNQPNNNMNNANYDNMMVNTVNSMGGNNNNLGNGMPNNIPNNMNNMMNEPSACSMNNNFTNQLGGNDFMSNSSPVDDMFAAF